MKKNEKGFGAVEVLLVLVIIGIIAFVGWYVWDRNSKSTEQTTPSNNNSQSQQLDAYARTTTVPNDWKTFSSDKYKFSIAYPANWKVDESNGTLGEGSKATNKDFFSLGFRPYSTGPMEIQYQLNVSHETLEQAVAERKRVASENQSANNGSKLTITNEKRFTFDGHQTVRIDMTSNNGTAPSSYSSEIYISANGLLYKFDTSFHDKNALQDQNVLTVFESLKIK